MLSKVLMLCGGSVLLVLIAGRIVEIAAESYAKDRWVGLLAGAIVLGSIVAFVVGVLLHSRTGRE